MQPTRQDLIPRSEVRKMIEGKKKFYKKLFEDYKDEVGHQADLKLGCLQELLSELDNLSGVNIENLLPYPGMPEQGKPYGESIADKLSGVSGWIACSERLPEKEGVYLCFSKSVIETGYYNGKYWEYSGYELTYYTHWQPLPLPPHP